MKRKCGQRDDDAVHRVVRAAEVDKELAENLVADYDRLTHFVNSLLLRKKCTEDRAELLKDLVQDIVKQAWAGFDPAKSHRGLWPFLQEVAENRVADYFRKRGRRYRIAPQDSLDALMESRTSNDEHKVSPRADVVKDPRARFDEKIIEKITIEEAVQQLPPDQRQCVTKKYIEDLPNTEIARQLNEPEGTVGSRISRAKAGLRRQLEKDYID